MELGEMVWGNSAVTGLAFLLKTAVLDRPTVDPTRTRLKVDKVDFILKSVSSSSVAIAWFPSAPVILSLAHFHDRASAFHPVASAASDSPGSSPSPA